METPRLLTPCRAVSGGGTKTLSFAGSLTLPECEFWQWKALGSESLGPFPI